MTTSKIAVTEGSGKNLATNSISEDAVTKEVQRTVPNTSAGVEYSMNTGNADAGTQRVTLAADGATNTVLGATTGAKVITDANGAIQQYLRGLVYLFITAGGALVTATIAAGTALIGKISAGADTATIYNGTTALTPKWALANITASQTDSNIVTAVGGKIIRVVAMFAVTGATATNLTFNSKGGGAGTAISPLFANGINGGEVLPYNPVGWFQTASGEALTCTTGAGATTGIQVVYVEV
jgi:hypothetical protein